MDTLLETYLGNALGLINIYVIIKFDYNISRVICYPQLPNNKHLTYFLFPITTSNININA